MDVPASLTTGEIIKHLREKRGLTRPVLAGLLGYSTDWLKRIEGGTRGISLPALLDMAKILRVDDLSVFIDGDRVIPVEAFDGPIHPAADAVRRIMGPPTLIRRLDTAPDVDSLGRRLDATWRDWHTQPDNHTRGAVVLPGLIDELELATAALADPHRRRAFALLASAYGLVQYMAVDLVEPGLSQMIADRSLRAAQLADDPLSLAFAAWAYGNTLRRTDPEAALRVVEEAVRALRPVAEGAPAALGLYGSLQLHMAISAAHGEAAGIAWRHWDEAKRTADALPAGYFEPWTIFGPENVELHGVSLAANLRQPGDAVRRAAAIDPERIPSRERRGRLYGERAAGHMQRREWPEALAYLERSFTTSPEEAPFSPLTRGVAVELVRHTQGALKTEAVSLAERMGVLPAA